MMQRTFIKHCTRCNSEYPNVLKIGICRYCQYNNSPVKYKSRAKLLLCTAVFGGIGLHHVYVGRKPWLALGYLALAPFMGNLPLMIVSFIRYALMSRPAMNRLLGIPEASADTSRHVVSR